MAAALKSAPPGGANAEHPPLVVELVGPAGAGKTTTARALGRCGEAAVVVAPPYFRNLADLPFYIKNGFHLLRTLFAIFTAHQGWPTRREVAWMIILEGWPSVIRQRAASNVSVIVLDQGPVYLLTEVCDFGSASLRAPQAERWWHSVCERWAAVLDVVVWLDASDATLIKRIVKRNSRHQVKELSEAEALAFMERWRAAYQKVLARLTSSSPSPRLVCVDTGTESTDCIVARILNL